MSVPFDWKDFPPVDSAGVVSYVSGSAEHGYTRVTYGTAEGTSYEYIPTSQVVSGWDDVIFLDPNRPLSVEDDENDGW